MSHDSARACDSAPGCVTCGDVAVPMRVVRVGADASAVCADASGAAEEVACDLVWPVRPGDGVLVHARVAIARLGEGAA